MNAVKVTVKFARRIVIAVVGSTILLIGVIMIVTPGPAMVLIPTGLAILGLEFAWARLWLKRIRRKISSTVNNQQAKAAESHRDRHRD